MFRKFLVALPIVVLAVGGSTACATKKYVRTSVGEVNQKVDSQGRCDRGDAGADAQERRPHQRGRHQGGGGRAGGPGGQRRRRGGAHRRRPRSAPKPTPSSTPIDKANKRLVFEVVLSEDQGNFKFGKTALPDEAKAKIDEMVAQMKQDPKNIYLEIEGHTDNVGDKVTNEKIGLARAEAVKRYLYEQYQIPLHKMNVISYGKDKPVAPNKTQGGPRPEPPRRDQGARLDLPRDPGARRPAAATTAALGPSGFLSLDSQVSTLSSSSQPPAPSPF